MLFPSQQHASLRVERAGAGQGVRFAALCAGKPTGVRLLERIRKNPAFVNFEAVVLCEFATTRAWLKRGGGTYQRKMDGSSQPCDKLGVVSREKQLQLLGVHGSQCFWRLGRPIEL